MTKAEAARRYLQASMSAGYTGLPDEHREAQQQIMAGLEDKHPGVREHAIVGAPADFDKPLAAGEREHQRQLRAGASDTDLRARREIVRRAGEAPGGTPRARARAGSRRAAVRAGTVGARAYTRTRRQVASSSGAQATGSLLLQALGVAIGLSLLYLALSPKGSKGFATLLGGISGFLRLLVGPFDPLNPPRALPSTQVGRAVEIGAGGPLPASPVQRAKLNPAFGPAPGIGTPITPIGVTP